MKRWLLALGLSGLLSVAHALPTLAEVETEVQQGRYVQAQTMMQEVVSAKPQSAKAHYVYAELLAHNGEFVQASQQAALAKQIDPSLKFTQPDKFKAFEALLTRELQHAGGTPRPGSELDSLSRAVPNWPPVTTPATPNRVTSSSPGIPTWVWLAGLAGVGLIAWRVMRNKTSAPGWTAAGAGPYDQTFAQPMPSSPYPYPAGAPAGPGLMGVGLAAAGGVAAGMLAEKWLERGHEVHNDNSSFGRAGAMNAVPFQDDDARALESRQIDFGSGSDWGDDGGAAGATDTGGADGW